MLWIFKPSFVICEEPYSLKNWYFGIPYTLKNRYFCTVHVEEPVLWNTVHVEETVLWYGTVHIEEPVLWLVPHPHRTHYVWHGYCYAIVLLSDSYCDQTVCLAAVLPSTPQRFCTVRDLPLLLEGPHLEQLICRNRSGLIDRLFPTIFCYA
jgi:hypothetical protein